MKTLKYFIIPILFLIPEGVLASLFPSDYVQADWINYRTGEIFFVSSDMSKQPYMPEIKAYAEGNDSIYEYKINYAYKYNLKRPDTLSCWLIPCVDVNFGGQNLPGLSVIYPGGYVWEYDNDNIKNIEILDSSYVDFKLKICSNDYFPMIDSYYSDDITLSEWHPGITPYVGFYPLSPLKIRPQYNIRLYYELYLMQYDYEHEILRCYDYMKYKITYKESSILENKEDEEVPVFYDLMGMKIVEPQKGHIYIKKEKGSYQKILF